jgi:competence ComEA-like helix-hairpin-helix protein
MPTENRAQLAFVALVGIALGSAVTFGFTRLNAETPIIISDAVNVPPTPPIVTPGADAISDDPLTTPKPKDRKTRRLSSGRGGQAKKGRAAHHKITSGVVHLNSASLAQLEEIPGVGPSTAQSIIDFRTQSNGFQSVDELGDIPRMGAKKLKKILPFVAL